MKKNTAMQSVIKNAISLFKKSENLYLQREDNYVYLSEGHVIFRIPNSEYETEFCLASPRFPSLFDGEMRTARAKEKITSEGGPDLKKILKKISEDMKKGFYKHSKRLNLVIPDFETNKAFELFRTENEIVCVDTAYTALIPFHRNEIDDLNDYYSSIFRDGQGADRSPLIYTSAFEDLEVIILPVNRPHELDRLKEDLEGLL